MKRRKIQAVVMGLLISTTVFITAQGTTGAIEVNRIAGEDRYGTSAEICDTGWQGTTEYAVLATGENFPDALSATPLAKKLNAPILLTSKEELEPSTEAELQRLKVKKVFLVGGVGVLSSKVEEKLKAMKIQPTRLAGKDRYETAVKVAEKLGVINEVTLVNGEDYASALVMAPIAAKRNMPILLVAQGEMDATTKTYLKGKKITNSYVIGGEELIATDTYKGIPNVERIVGGDKYERNLSILDRFSKDLEYKNAYIATGENFPDALSGSALAAQSAAPIFLVPRDMSNSTKEYLAPKLSMNSKVWLLGGESIVSTIDFSKRNQEQGGTTSVPNDGIPNIEGNTAGNLGCEGRVAQQGNWIYYVNDGYLYKMTKEGKYKTSVCKDNPSYVNVVGPWIYYSNGYDKGKIYKIGTDGFGKTDVCQDSTKYMYVNGDWIYYENEYDGGKLYKVKIDGTRKTKLCEDRVKYIVLSEDWIYYSNVSENGSLYKVKIDGGQRTKLNDVESAYINVSGDWIYYSNVSGDGDIYKMQKSGTENKKLFANDGRKNTAKQINVSGEYIYYNLSNSSYWNRLYKIDKNGGEKISITDSVLDVLYIAGEKLYYMNSGEYNCLYNMNLDGSMKQAVK